MKKIFLTTLTVIFVALGMHAATTNYNNNKPFVFMESGIEFAVFTDGQFDFNLIQPSYTGVHVNTRNINFSYNSGHNYDAYIQYDHYGAVIQVENTPIFYDYYGRVQRIGNIHFDYNHRGLVRRLGNMHITYNHYGNIVNVNGIINNYNRYCPNRDRYVYYRRPVANRVVVYHTPYRRNFAPNRCNYSVYRNNYYRNHRNNSVRRNFDRPGYNNRVVTNNRKVVVKRNNNSNNYNKNYRTNTHNKKAVVKRNNNSNNYRRNYKVNSNNKNRVVTTTRTTTYRTR